MAYDRRTFILFCLTAEESKLQELLTGMREEAAAIKDRMDDLEVFLAHRPDLKAEEPAAPEKPKRKPKATKVNFDEIEEMKTTISTFIRALADSDVLDKINSGLAMNHGLSTATLDSWTLTDCQNAWALIQTFRK